MTVTSTDICVRFRDHDYIMNGIGGSDASQRDASTVHYRCNGSRKPHLADPAMLNAAVLVKSKKQCKRLGCHQPNFSAS